MKYLTLKISLSARAGAVFDKSRRKTRNRVNLRGKCPFTGKGLSLFEKGLPRKWVRTFRGEPWPIKRWASIPMSDLEKKFSALDTDAARSFLRGRPFLPSRTFDGAPVRVRFDAFVKAVEWPRLSFPLFSRGLQPRAALIRLLLIFNLWIITSVAKQNTDFKTN